MRLLLGLAEAGFFPGMILYMTYWFPAAQRARAVALFMTATAVAGAFGGPISGALLDMNGHGGLRGWQWLFVAEGVPAVLLGIAVFFVLPNGPDDVRWLSDEEREWLKFRLARDAAAVDHHHPSDLLRALGSARVWQLCAVYFTVSIGLYCVSMWLPQMVKAAFPVQSNWKIGFLTAVPYSAAALAMVLVSAHADRAGERRWHVAGSLLFAASAAVTAAALGAATHRPALTLAAFAVAAVGIWSSMGPFWALPPTFLRGTAARRGGHCTTRMVQKSSERFSSNR